MVLAETFWQVIWTMFIFFMWVLWIWLLIIVFMDVFRNRESSGLAKARAWPSGGRRRHRPCKPASTRR